MKNLQSLIKCTATFSVVTATTLSIAQPAKAILLSVTDGVTVTSSTSGTDLFSVDNLVDLSGLSGDPNTESNVTHAFFNSSNSWVTDDVGIGNDYYNSLPTPVLTFDLGEDKDLSGFLLGLSG